MSLDKNLLRLTRVTVLGAGAVLAYQTPPVPEAYASCSICVNYAVCEGFRNSGYDSCNSNPTCHNNDVPCSS
jgi:hypothetical protein